MTESRERERFFFKQLVLKEFWELNIQIDGAWWGWDGDWQIGVLGVEIGKSMA